MNDTIITLTTGILIGAGTGYWLGRRSAESLVNKCLDILKTCQNVANSIKEDIENAQKINDLSKRLFIESQSYKKETP